MTTKETKKDALKVPARNSDATKQRIIKAAREEFTRYGFAGARVERIAEAAKANMQLIYRYFGKKDELYVAILEDAYLQIRQNELTLDLAHLDPLDGILKLTEFTFDYLSNNQYFVRLMMNENLMEASFARKSQFIPTSAQPLVSALRDLLARGERKGHFAAIDPVELYIVILSLCFVHISNQHTLGIMFRKKLSSKAALETRRELVVRCVRALIQS
jgi:AcrR family transcriptional regulator